jgi:hypothetical protein
MKINRHSPYSRWVWARIARLGALGNDKSRAAGRSNRKVDGAEALKRAASAVSGRTPAVVACII